MRHFYNIMLRVKQVLTEMTFTTKSLELNGTSQAMDIADSDSISFGDESTDSPFSVTFWVRANKSGDLFTKAGEYRIFLSSGNIRSYIQDNGFANRLDNRWNFDTDYGLFNNNTWVHFAFTYDGSGDVTGVKAYYYGIEIPKGLESEFGTYVAMHNTTATLSMGRRGGASYLDGGFYRPTLWGKALSQEEIREDMLLRDITQHSAYGDIISNWSFEDANISGSTVSDTVGSNDGTLIDSPSTIEGLPFPYDYQLETTSFWTNAHPYFYAGAASLAKFGGYHWDFGGTNEYITIPDDDTLSNETMSISAWINMSDATNFIIANKTGEYQFFVNGSDKLEVRYYDDSASAYIGRTYDTALASYEGTWIHVATTKSSGSTSAAISLEINGVTVDDTDSNSGTYVAMENLTNALTIGTNGTNYAIGKVADVMINDEVITPSAIFNNHEPRDETKNGVSLAGYWRAYHSSNTASGVLDQSGNGNNGTMTNMENTDIWYGYPREVFDIANGNEGSFDFGGTNQFIDITDNSSHTFGNGTTDSPFSLSAWVNMDDATEFSIFAKDDASTNREYILFCNSGDQLDFYLFDSSTGGFIGRRYSTALTSREGEWILITATYEGANGVNGVRLYVNGARVDNTNLSGGGYTAMEDKAQNLYIGRRGSNYSNGKMAHASIWSKELSQQEIQEIYNDGSPIDLSQHTASGNLVSWWRMDGSDDPTGTVTDIQGVQNGTATNMVSGDLSTTDYPTN